MPEKYISTEIDLHPPAAQCQSYAAEAAVDVFQLPAEGIDMKKHLNDIEISLIEQALNETNNVVARAANLLNMRRTTLVEKMRKYEIER